MGRLDRTGLPESTGPLFILFVSQHAACLRMLCALKRRQIRPRDAHDKYLAELEKFWAMNEAELAVFRIDKARSDRMQWQDFCVARELYERTNGAVLLDRDLRP